MLLQKVDEFGTLSDAAKDLRMSYRHAWGMIRRAEEALGEPLLKFWKGGRKGGGGAQITESGRKMINEYLRLKRELSALGCVAGELSQAEKNAKKNRAGK